MARRLPYHYGGRWEGKPFTYKIDAKGPDKAAVTVSGGGKVAVGLLHWLGIDVANPLDLNVERTMTIEPGTTRLRIDVKITNTGDGVAPSFRYMVHAVYGQVPPMAGGRAFWFLSPPRTALSSSTPGAATADNVGGGQRRAGRSTVQPGSSPAGRPTSRAYEAGGWGAVLTSAGQTYIYYDPAKYDFMQYWFGGDAEWHFTFEPHTKPVDLKPGETMQASFTLAFDSKDVPFNTATVAYERPAVPDIAMVGGVLKVTTRATTVQDKTEKATLIFEIKDPKGRSSCPRPPRATCSPSPSPT